MFNSAQRTWSAGLRPLVLLLVCVGCDDPDSNENSDAGHDTVNVGDSAVEAGTSDGAAEEGGAATQQALLNCSASELTFKMVDVGEVKLNVGCQGSGPTLLLLHGFPEFSRSWSRFIPSLVSAGYRVVVPDQRGFNLSDKPQDVESYRVEHLVADVAGLVAATGEKKVLVLAHDWGGVVAWVFAHNYPEQLRGLVVMAGPHPDVWGHPEVDDEQAMASSAYIPLLVGGNMTKFQVVFDSQLSAYLTDDELALHHAAWTQPDAYPSMRNWYAANIYPEVTMPTNVTVDTPALLTWGMNDTFTVPSELNHIPAYVKNLTVHVWPDAGHWLLFEKVEETVKLIIDFEKQLSP